MRVGFHYRDFPKWFKPFTISTHFVFVVLCAAGGGCGVLIFIIHIFQRDTTMDNSLHILYTSLILNSLYIERVHIYRESMVVYNIFCSSSGLKYCLQYSKILRKLAYAHYCLQYFFIPVVAIILFTIFKTIKKGLICISPII